MLIFQLKVEFKICCSHPKIGSPSTDRTYDIFVNSEAQLPLCYRGINFWRCYEGSYPTVVCIGCAAYTSRTHFLTRQCLLCGSCFPLDSYLLNLRVVPPILLEPFTLVYKAGKVSVRHLGYLTKVLRCVYGTRTRPSFSLVGPSKKPSSESFSC